MDAVSGVIRTWIEDTVRGPVPTMEYPELRTKFFADVVALRIDFERKVRARMWADWRREQRTGPDCDDQPGYR